jgi:hypothetical protein
MSFPHSATVNFTRSGRATRSESRRFALQWTIGGVIGRFPTGVSNAETAREVLNASPSYPTHARASYAFSVYTANQIPR